MIIVKLKKSTLDEQDRHLPVHDTVKGSHWVGVSKLTVKALTEERKNIIYAQ